VAQRRTQHALSPPWSTPSDLKSRQDRRTADVPAACRLAAAKQVLKPDPPCPMPASHVLVKVTTTCKVRRQESLYCNQEPRAKLSCLSSADFGAEVAHHWQKKSWDSTGVIPRRNATRHITCCKVQNRVSQGSLSTLEKYGHTSKSRLAVVLVINEHIH
jgi:hypothetical protein